MTALNCAVLTISDSRTLKEDTSGALLTELISSPLDHILGMLVEGGRIDTPTHHRIVVAQDEVVGVLVDALEHRSGHRPISHHIPQADHGVDALRADIRQHRFPGLEVGMDV